MAVSRTTSNGPEWADLAEMLQAFQEQNQCVIEATVSLEVTGGIADLRLSAKAWAPETDRRVAKHLASVSVRCRAERLRTMAAALTYLLYKLDFAIAESAWQDALDIRAKHPRT